MLKISRASRIKLSLDLYPVNSRQIYSGDILKLWRMRGWQVDTPENPLIHFENEIIFIEHSTAFIAVELLLYNCQYQSMMVRDISTNKENHILFIAFKDILDIYSIMGYTEGPKWKELALAAL